MASHRKLEGVYAAALTPLKDDFSPDLAALPYLLDFYAQRGCHGALLMGTTGEGPSFATGERMEILRKALEIRQSHPDFGLLAGTGTPSMEETSALTKAAFDLGYNGVVVLPPFYYRKASDEGLFTWFSQVIQRTVPTDGAVLGYHIPAVSGVSLSLDLLARLKDSFQQFAGLKDSSGDPEHAKHLGERFGRELVVLTGNDRLLSLALDNQAAGCITALANLFSPILRAIWDAHQLGNSDSQNQAKIKAWRTIMEKYQPFAASLKALIAELYEFPRWPVRPPLESLPRDLTQEALKEIQSISG
jgi:4-hydroxy-tetrahydrodipicolinate synthase